MNRIKEARKAAGLSQKFVAMALGVASPSVCNWESGKTQPTSENLVALANLFGVSSDYLLGMSDDAEKQEQAPPATEEELDDAIAGMLGDLTPEEVQRVQDFIAGMKAARKE